MINYDNSIVADLLLLYENQILEFKELLELIGYLTGIKKMIRLAGRSIKLASIEAYASQRGWSLVYLDMMLEENFANDLSDVFYNHVRISCKPSGLKIGFMGPADLVEGAIQNESGACDNAIAADLYGIPSCCAAQYNHIQDGVPWIDLFLKKTKILQQLPWNINKAASLFSPYLSFVPDYFPCSVDCYQSQAISLKYIDAFSSLNLERLTQIVRDHCKGLILSVAGHVALINKYRVTGSLITVPDNFNVLHYDRKFNYCAWLEATRAIEIKQGLVCFHSQTSKSIPSSEVKLVEFV